MPQDRFLMLSAYYAAIAAGIMLAWFLTAWHFDRRKGRRG